jgi:hypothetical protein
MTRRTWLSSCWIAGTSLALTALLGSTAVGAVPISSSATPTPTPTWTPSSTTWSIVASPNNGTDVNSLSGVACASAKLCWAVGYYTDDTSGLDQTLIEEWAGTSWSVVTSPNGSSDDTDANSYLSGVACASATLCWAVGHYSGDYDQTLIEEWDGIGTTWTVVPSPDAGSFDNHLNGVGCGSASECWAVGYYVGSDESQDVLIEEWDGTSWTLNVPAADSKTDSAQGVLYGVACAGADDCWAAGYGSGGDYDQTLIEGWDGASWSPADSPDSGTSDNDLYGVTCASSTECWAVGDYFGSDEGAHILILGLVGGSWTTAVGGYLETESAAGYLNGVACASAGECWAVGRAADSDGYDQVVAESWAGTSWTSVAAPDSSTPDTPYSGDVNNALSGAGCAPAAECFAVGSYGYEDPTLVEEYPAATTSTPTPTPIPVPNTGATGGLVWPAGAVLAVLGALLIGTAMAWRRERRAGGAADRSIP